jgi:hypothetical protein
VHLLADENVPVLEDRFTVVDTDRIRQRPLLTLE